MSIDTDVLIIGAGPSGLGMAVQLVRNFNTRSFEIIEKTSDVGGTWLLNSYPGCGCDSRKFALQPEIHRYFASVVDQYDIRPHVQFHSAVKLAEYEPETATWKVVIENQKTGRRFHKRCRILVSAVGALSVPRGCDIPGADKFTGRLFHSAQWDHSFDYTDKNVVCVGNGCSATQFVPAMSDSPNQVKRITQFARQAHWLSARPNPEYSRVFQFIMRWVPGAQRLYRAFLFLMQEKDFAGFHRENGQDLRNEWTAAATEYILKHSPAKYRDFLVPNTTIGCKRRVMDTDYLACLHRENVGLIHDDPIDRITEIGVTTKSGREIHADAIVLANGFETQKPLFPMEIRGQNGQSVADHWADFADGSPEAYFGTCLSGFPNFFILMGPNTLSGHLSVIYTTECQINFVLRIIRPILNGTNRSLLLSLLGIESPDSVTVTSVAERKDNAQTDHKAKQLVWASGCTSWFIDPSTGRNTIMFPDWQSKFYLRSVFIPWNDFVYRKAPRGLAREVAVRSPLMNAVAFAGTVIGKNPFPPLFDTPEVNDSQSVTCKQRKLKCDEKKPICGPCSKALRTCEYVSGAEFRHFEAPTPTRSGSEQIEGNVWVDVPRQRTVIFMNLADVVDRDERSLGLQPGVTVSSTLRDRVPVESGAIQAYLLWYFKQGPGQWLSMLAATHPMLLSAACALSAKRISREPNSPREMRQMLPNQPNQALLSWAGINWRFQAIQFYGETIQKLKEALMPDSINLRIQSGEDFPEDILGAVAIMSVYELMDAPGAEWRAHLSALPLLSEAAKSVNLPNSLDQSLDHGRRSIFWSFTRQDVISAFVHETQTFLDLDDRDLWHRFGLKTGDFGISMPSHGGDVSHFSPPSDWTEGPLPEESASNAVTWILGRIINFITSGDSLDPHEFSSPAARQALFPVPQETLLRRWNLLNTDLQRWYQSRPQTFSPCARSTIGSEPAFERIWYTVPMCAAAMQSYHMGRILLLMNRPQESTAVRSTVASRLKSYQETGVYVLSHSREICGISLSMPPESVRIHSLQPLFIAGQCLSSPHERQVVLDLLRGVDKDLGWASAYYVDKLHEEWRRVDEVSDLAEYSAR
ncbi:hypothetical protein FE257_010815 [Aspergillus nanangensis]|uniref:Zn(2)-C6 fungal-type domain-containing protein n=1 Tax=Aspergillus nanangensis TaxID=2582783 RepID=A0AAD4GZB6_ASPNN|nr:hypothetical protein FE257_010815 [Aspergillus nanangensis]